ncbi:TerC family protein [Caenibacillus caldisaponilyticus]|uniref:TerC family protein n=1 Tax=Caenibacillus caldisaponilyticus TaxID=1674942 RepID=UPI0009887288|nr:TerC family protein [Caenibacillus caldisaponilyticus]
MAIFSWEFWSSLLLIVGIDLVLAGDNAIVIGLAARKLPARDRKKVILLGALGAVGIRVLAAVLIVTLLKIPGLHLIGGLLLLRIAYRLLVDQKEQEEVPAGETLWKAVRTIILADALMGLDNVLAIAGASHDSYLLVTIGLFVSVPIVMWGSTLFIRLLDRFSWLIYAGSAILAYTAGKMIFAEPFVAGLVPHPLIKYAVILAAMCGVVALGAKKNRAAAAKTLTDNKIAQ